MTATERSPWHTINGVIQWGHTLGNCICGARTERRALDRNARAYAIIVDGQAKIVTVAPNGTATSEHGAGSLSAARILADAHNKLNGFES